MKNAGTAKYITIASAVTTAKTIVRPNCTKNHSINYPYFKVLENKVIVKLFNKPGCVSVPTA